MTLGGLKEGVTPLELAYAYSHDRQPRRAGVRASWPPRRWARWPSTAWTSAGRDDKNERKSRAGVPRQGGRDGARSMLAGVVQGGTGKAAQIGEFAAGKTGTTENYGDAWFVGFNKADDGGRVGRLPRRAQADEDRVPRRPGGRRHLPDRDLARLHDAPGSPSATAATPSAARSATTEEAPDGPVHAGARRAPAGAAAAPAQSPSRTSGAQDDAPDQAPQRTPAPRQPSTPAQPQQPAPQAPAQTPTPAPGGRRRRRAPTP